MSQQTSVGNLPDGLPGLISGIRYDARSLKNEAGDEREIIDLSFTAVNSATYTVSVNVENQDFSFAYTADASATVAEIRDGLLAEMNADPLFTDLVAPLASGNNIRLTAREPNYDMTVSGLDANTAQTAIQAATATVEIPFGYAVKAGAIENSMALPTAGAAILGVVSRQHADADAQKNPGALRPLSTGSVVYRGEIWVKVEDEVTAGAGAFVRTANGNEGLFRSDADGGDAEALSNAKYLTGRKAGGIALLAINLV